MATGSAATQLLQYYFYKQSTFVSSNADGTCFPILSVADGANGQLVITTDDTTSLSAGAAIMIDGTTQYDGNYSCISLTPTTFNVSGIFIATDTGTWELASAVTGANAGDHLDFGKIYFYDNSDKVTLQDTYTDRDLTILNTNPIVLDAIGSTPVPYLLDNPYYIEIFDKFNNLVTTLDNYLPGAEDDIPTSELPLENLFPNYGFDTKINANIFDEEDVGANTTVAVSAGWFWEIATTESNPKNTYTYNALSTSSIIGNPKNELLLRSTNNTTGQSINNLFSVIGDYNSFQGQQLALSIFTRLVSGSTQTIPCELIRTKNGIKETPIPIGSISIVPSRTQQLLVFTVPALTTANYDNTDELRIVCNLPLNEDFQQGYTATWSQISPNGDVSISETAGSTDAAKEFFGKSGRPLQKDSQHEITGLPVAIGLGEMEILNTTGTIYQASVGSNFLFSQSMVQMPSSDPGFELIRNEPVGKSQANRLIDYMRPRGLTQSRHTFIATSATNIVTVKTGIGTSENSSWQTAAAPRITVSKPVDELIYKLNATTLGNGKTLFTFTENFSANTTAFNPQYSAGGGDVYTTLPLSSPLINWVGTDNFDSPVSTGNTFHPRIRSEIVNVGSGIVPAQVNIHFQNVETYAQYGRHGQNGNEGPGSSPLVLENEYSELPLYRGTSASVRIFVSNAQSNIASDVPQGFLAYNDSTNNPDPQLINPPRSIRFTVDGIASTAPTGIISTANVFLFSGDSKERVSVAVSEAINTSFEHEITIVSIPTNGDIVEISNDVTDFNLIFFDTALTKPTNPSAVRKAIFVEYSAAQTTAQIAASTVTAINNGVMGIPRAADLGLRFSDGLQYYMIF